MKELKIPILICAAGGTVKHKNIAAKKWLRAPRIGANMRRFLLNMPPEACADKIAAIASGEEDAAILEVHTESCYRRALAARYSADSEDEVIFLFSPLLQIGDFNPNYNPIESVLTEHCNALVALIRNLPESAPPDEPRTPALRRIHGSDEKFTETFTKLLRAHSDAFPAYGLTRAVQMLRRVGGEILNELGYRAFFDFEDLRFAPDDVVYAFGDTVYQSVGRGAGNVGAEASRYPMRHARDRVFPRDRGAHARADSALRRRDLITASAGASRSGGSAYVCMAVQRL